MGEIQTLRAEGRAKTGKGGARQTRRRGFIPAVVYGGSDTPQAVQVEETSFFKLYASGTLRSTLLMLEVENSRTRVIPRAVQTDPVTDRPIHVDFMRLAEGARVALNIPVHFRGHEASPGLKRGGVLNVVRHEVELHCPADNVPAYIEGDLTGLDIGDSLHISAFALPDGVTPVIQNRDFTVATIARPSSFVEEVAAAAVPTGEVPATAVEAESGGEGAGGKAAEKK